MTRSVQPKPWKRGERVTADRLQQSQAMGIQRVFGSGEVTVQRIGPNVTIDVPKRGRGGADFKPYKITGSTQDGSNKRWSYTMIEQVKTAAGYGGWTDKPGALSITGYNMIEDINTDTGTYGNGVTQASLNGPRDGDFDIQPMPNGLTVWGKSVTFTVGDESISEVWFGEPNGVDGTCDGGA